MHRRGLVAFEKSDHLGLDAWWQPLGEIHVSNKHIIWRAPIYSSQSLFPGENDDNWWQHHGIFGVLVRDKSTLPNFIEFHFWHLYIYIQKCMCMSNVFKTRTGSVQGNTFSKPMNFRVNTVSLSTVNKIVNQSIETGWGAHVSSFCFITSPPVWTDESAFPSSFHTWRNYGISCHRKVSQQLIWLEHIRTIFRTYTYHTYYCYCLVCSCSISFVWLFQNGIETSVHVNLAPISTGVPLVTLALWWTWEVWNLATHSAKQCLLNPSWVMVQTGFILSTFVWDGG